MQEVPPNSTVEETEIFNYPFMIDSTTVSYIKENARVMFLIRGLPYTGKTKISLTLKNVYSNAIYCSAVKFMNTLNPVDDVSLQRKELMLETRILCETKAKEAFLRNEKIIIIQNTHMGKREFQYYLNLAASHNYATVMIVASKLSEVTPEVIAKNNPNGLKIDYLKKRYSYWEDVLPIFMGWFISADDSLHIHKFVLSSLECLLEDLEFCEVFKVGNREELRKCFHLRKVLSCLAGYFEDPLDMKKYYYSSEVQASYGKAFTIAIVGYLVTSSGIIGIVQIDEFMEWLLADTEQEIKYIKKRGKRLPCHTKVALNTTGSKENVLKHGETFEFQENHKLPQNTSVTFADWSDNENISISSFIHLGQRNVDLFDIPKIKSEFEFFMKQFGELCNMTKLYKIPDNNVWLVKAPRIMSVKTIFTGFYP